MSSSTICIASKNILIRDWKSRIETELSYFNCEGGLKSDCTDIGKKKLTASILKNCIDDEHLRVISGVEEPADMITALEDFRMPKSSVGDIPILRKLNNMYYDGTTSVTDFILEFENLISDLGSFSNEAVSERVKKRHLIIAVEETFPIVKITERSTKGSITYGELKKRANKRSC